MKKDAVSITQSKHTAVGAWECITMVVLDSSVEGRVTIEMYYIIVVIMLKLRGSYRARLT